MGPEGKWFSSLFSRPRVDPAAQRHSISSARALPTDRHRLRNARSQAMITCMRLSLPIFGLYLLSLAQGIALPATDTGKLPPPAPHTVDFEKEIKPLFEAACVK